jgi:hypothetical protein
MKLFVPLMFICLSAILPNPIAANASSRVKVPAIRPTVLIRCADRISGGEASGCRVSVDEGQDREITIGLRSSNTSLIRLSVNEVTLAPQQTSAPVLFTSSSTQIKSTVVIQAGLNQSVAEKSIEVVPALLDSVRLADRSLVGTKGEKISCTVKLRAPAPTGGIEIYLSPLSVSPRTNKTPVSLDLPNPRVSAGQASVNFNIAYDDLRAFGTRISEFEITGVSTDATGPSDFNVQTRTVELVVALDPQTSYPWQAISGLATKVTFDVVPLRVTSLVSQPASVIGGAEALAAVTLSASPGSSEVAYLLPLRTSSSTKLWLVLPGSSCAAQPGTTTTSSGTYINGVRAVELALAPGTTTYTFKICTAAVSAVTTDKIRVFLRSGAFETPVTIQPQ